MRVEDAIVGREEEDMEERKRSASMGQTMGPRRRLVAWGVGGDESANDGRRTFERDRGGF